MRVLIVHNPRAGGREAGLRAYCAALDLLGVSFELRVLEAGGSLEGLLEDASGFDRVVAAGGDGTVSGVAFALRDSGVPIVAYPAGTGNAVANNLGVPNDPTALAWLTATGEARATDLGELVFDDGSRVGFGLAAGAGYDAELIARSNELKARFGVGAYVLAGAAIAQPTVAQFTLECDGQTIVTSGMGVMVMNFSRVLGLQVLPTANAHDGMLDVVVIRARSSAELVPVFARAALERMGLAGSELSDRLEVYQAKEVRVLADPLLKMQADGDPLTQTTPFSAHVKPGAAVFVVPSTRE